jgi:uncharacterized protein involved in response to NO
MTGQKATTRGEEMLALRRRREAASIPFFRGGFRPFFFAGPVWAVAALTLWLLTLGGRVDLPTAIDPLAWHRHEMLFGFVGAVIGGFLLTAVPNWTGRLPIAGWPLAGLLGLWSAARLALLCSAAVGVYVAAILDVGFFVTLALLAAREVLQSKNRNLPVVGLILLFGLADALDYLCAGGAIADPDLGWQLAVSIVLILISLIGGRIIPSFTRNWMAKQGFTRGLPTQPGRFDVMVIGATAFALLAWISGPQTVPIGIVIGLAALLQAIRLARWRGFRTWRDPLVLILHVGYAWVPIGLGLLGLSVAGMLPRSAAIHAITAGAMTTMIVAVMTRASLGHTGRELRANAATVGVYVLVTAGAMLRVCASLAVIDYNMGLEIAGAAWCAGLVLFLLAYGPVLWRPRLGG